MSRATPISRFLNKAVNFNRPSWFGQETFLFASAFNEPVINALQLATDIRRPVAMSRGLGFCSVCFGHLRMNHGVRVLSSIISFL